MISDSKADVVNTRNQLVRILDQQTIRRVQNECEALLEEETLPHFRDFFENESDFILTERRENILEQIHSRLRSQESSGVILHGSYGSGKTVLMECVADLCQGDQNIGGVTFPQFTYGDTKISCFKISLQQHDSPKKFLLRLYTVILSSEKITEDDLIARFNEEKSSLSLDGYDSLPSNVASELKDYFDDPQSLEDIATACKSLSAPSAHETITWFSEEYYKAEDCYPAFYVDEFEQVFRHLDPTEEHSLKRLIKKMMRSAVTSHEELDTPPYILFINSVGLNELDETIQAAEDLVSRLEQSISYNIDLSREETKQLFAELYHIYTVPLVEDHSNAVPEWWEKLTSAPAEADDYIFPLTDDALEFALSVVDIQEDSDRDEKVVRAFRAYKSVLMAFFETWEGDAKIDRNYLYQKGDEVRNRIAQLERADISKLPGKQSIRERIEEDYEEESIAIQRLLTEIARRGILEREENPALFSPREIEEIADKTEVDLTISITSFIHTASGVVDYFNSGDNHLRLDRDKLTGAAASQESKTRSEIVRETVNELDLTGKDTRKQWETALRKEFATDLDIINKGNYLEIDVLKQFQYTETVYFSLNSTRRPTELNASFDSNALHFAIHLGPSRSSRVPAEFEVKERNDRAASVVDGIENALNKNVESHIDKDKNTSTLLEDISDAYPERDEFDQYRLFLKLSLAEILGEDLPEEIKDRTSDRRVFNILRYVRESVKGQYNSGEYVPKKLGLSSGYSGQDTLDVIYGIKHLKRESEFIYKNPNVLEISRDLPRISNISRGKESGDGFRNVLSKFSEERFIKQSGDEFDVIHEFNEGTQNTINSLEVALHDAEDDELSFEEILEEIFGTTSVAPVVESYVHLILNVVDLYEDPFILSGDQDSKIVLPESELQTVREQTKGSLENAIKREALVQAKTENPNYSNISSYSEKYNNIDKYNDFESLEQIAESVETDFTINNINLEQAVRNLGSESVYTETMVTSYITDIRNLSEFESGLPFLIEDDLQRLVNELETAAEILREKETIENYLDTVRTLADDSIAVNPSDIKIDCVNAVTEHLESHNVSSVIDNASIDDDVGDYLHGDADAEMLIKRLRRLRKAIVPAVGEYDPTNDKNTLTNSKRELKVKFETEVESEKEKVTQAQGQLEQYEPRIPEGETALITKARRQLEQCESILDESICNFDATRYNNLWKSWQNTESELAEHALSSDEISDMINEIGADISTSMVTHTDTDLNSIVETVNDKDSFRQIVNSLNIDLDAAQQMQAALIKRWLQESNKQ